MMWMLSGQGKMRWRRHRLTGGTHLSAAKKRIKRVRLLPLMEFELKMYCRIWKE
jgi:hypothetical protein